MQKNRGGRGRRAPNKHETVTISLPPQLKAALDAAVTPDVSRSEVVAQLIAQHLMPQAAQVQVPRKAGKGSAAPQPVHTPQPSRAKSTVNLPPAVTVMAQRMNRGIKWKPEKYALAERLLAQGHTLTRLPEGADYSTEAGEVMSWRTVQALLRLGVVVPLV